MLVYWTQAPTSSSVSLFWASVTENRLNDSNLLTDTCRRQSSRCFCFRAFEIKPNIVVTLYKYKLNVQHLSGKGTFISNNGRLDNSDQHLTEDN